MHGSGAPRVRRARSPWRRLLHEVGAFGVVGGVCFAIDLALFQLTYAHLGWGAVTSKLTSTLVSTTIAYVAHRHWSFGHRARTGVRREYCLFAAINGVTLLIGLAIVAVVRYPLAHDGPLALQVANVASIATGTVVRYVSYRTWVFPATARRESPGPEPA